MPETCENWPRLVNCSEYYACQTHDIHQVLPHLKLPGSFEIHWIRPYLVNEVLVGIQDL